MNPFDYVNSINMTKKDVMVDDIAEKSYNSFMVNRSLSYFYDTVLLANEMNRYNHIDNRLQFDFLLNTVHKKKRFSKWIKPNEIDSLDAVKTYFGYSYEKAKSALAVLDNETIEQIKYKVNQGGRK